jgi:SAM-dependent methyltransferase
VAKAVVSQLSYRCPVCFGVLDSPGVHCAECGREFPSVQVGKTHIVDFLSATRPLGECNCSTDQRQKDGACEVYLDRLRAPNHVVRPMHPKASVLAAYSRWRNRVVLDAGCREGPLGYVLADNNYVIGLDLCPYAMLEATPNALDKGYGELWIADAAHIPLAAEQVDLVLANDILEHVVTPEVLLAEFFRVLKPGGQLNLTVPNLVSYGNRISILFGSGVGIEPHLLLKGQSMIRPIAGVRYPDQRKHLRFFTLKSMCHTLEQAGFEIIERRGYDPVLSRLPLGDRLLRNMCSLVAVRAIKKLSPNMLIHGDA